MTSADERPWPGGPRPLPRPRIKAPKDALGSHNLSFFSRRRNIADASSMRTPNCQTAALLLCLATVGAFFTGAFHLRMPHRWYHACARPPCGRVGRQLPLHQGYNSNEKCSIESERRREATVCLSDSPCAFVLRLRLRHATSFSHPRTSKGAACSMLHAESRFYCTLVTCPWLDPCLGSASAPCPQVTLMRSPMPGPMPGHGAHASRTAQCPSQRRPHQVPLLAPAAVRALLRCCYAMRVSYCLVIISGSRGCTPCLLHASRCLRPGRRHHQ